MSEGIRISKQESRAARSKSKKREKGRKLVRGSEYPSKKAGQQEAKVRREKGGENE